MLIAVLFIIAKRLRKLKFLKECIKVVYPYNGILLSHKKDQSTATCYNVVVP